MEQNLDIQKKLNDILFKNQESNITHHHYERELYELNAVRNGNIELVKTLHFEQHPWSYGLLSDDKVRSFQNIIIIGITLFTRAAIEGGVHSEVAFSLSDSYIQEMEKIKDMEKLEHLFFESKIHFTNLVKESKFNKINTNLYHDEHPFVSKCKDYVWAHMHEKISVNVIATQIKISPNYLSDLFRKYEGMSVGEYILQSKLGLVQNLLMYSNYTYSEIATYFGFCSQSHLGTYFKKNTGYTLHQFKSKFSPSEIYTT